MSPELPDADRFRVGWWLLTELIHGEGVTPQVNAAESIGADPESED